MMGKCLQRYAATGFMMVGALLLAVHPAEGQAVSAVPTLDLNRYMGSWFEVARLPNKREKECKSDALVLYALADKPRQFQLVTTCRIGKGNTDSRNAGGKLVDTTGDGRLKLTYIWPFTSKYWVLAVGPEYEWALVGSPDHKTLWILSRTAALPPEKLAELKAMAAGEGFDMAKLITVSQRH